MDIPNKFLRKAFLIALEHPHRDEVISLHCAIIVKGGKILSIGINKPKRNMFVDLNAHHPGCTIHAEVDAVNKIRRKIDLTGTKIFVAKAKKSNGKPGISKPCPMCQLILDKYGIKKIQYTIEEK